MKRLRVAVIGLGNMGRAHARTLVEHFPRRAEVVAAADPRREARRLARGLGIPGVFADARTLVHAVDFDEAVVATPSDRHCECLREVMTKARVILCEKPMAHTAADCRRTMRLVRAFKGRVFFDLELRTDAGFRAMKRLIDRGRLGTPRLAWCKEFRGPFLEKPDRWIQRQERSGGALVDKCVHYFDLFGWPLGARPTRVSATGGRDVHTRLYGAPYTVMDSAVATIDYEGSKRASMILCMFARKPVDGGMEVGVIGEEGMAVYPFDRMLVRAGDWTGRTRTIRVRVPKRIAKVSHRGLLYYQHRSVLDALNGRCRDAASAEDAYWATITAIAGE